MDKIRILFLAADPTDSTRLRLGEELRNIRERLQLSKQRDGFSLESRESMRPGDLTQAIFDVEPQIIHFSGHGMDTGELCFEDSVGKTQPVSPAALASIFKLVAAQVNCVILNACHSTIQAKAIAEHIPFVVGMNQSIGDRSAIAFAVGFYKALGAGRSIEDAYAFACAEIQLQGTPEHSTPVLHTKFATPASEQTQCEVNFNNLVLPSIDSELRESRQASSCYDFKHFRDLNRVHYAILSLSFLYSPLRLLTVASDCTLCSWSLEEDSFAEQSISLKASYASYSSNGKQLAICCFNRVQLVSLPEARSLQTLPHPDVKTVCFSSNQPIIASAGGAIEGTIRVWNTNTKRIISTLLHKATVTTVAFTSDSKILAAGSSDKIVRLWRVDSQERLREFYLGSIPCSAVFTHDNRLLAVGCADGSIVCLHVDGTKIHESKCHNSTVNSIELDTEGQLLFSASDDGEVGIWELPKFNRTQTLKHDFPVKKLAVAKTQNMLAAGLSNGNVRLWIGS